MQVRFQSLCPTSRAHIYLDRIHTGVEYRPNYYEEVFCMHGYINHKENNPKLNKVDDGVRIILLFSMN